MNPAAPPGASSSSAPALVLVVFVGGAAQSHPLPARGAVSIGRAADNDIQIDDASVSRRHAVLHVGATLAIEDLGSANGTRVRTPGPAGETTAVVDRPVVRGERVTIALDEPINLGSIVAVVHAEDPHAAAAKPGASAPGARPEPAFVVQDPRMRELHALLARVAEGTISVLLLGETGVGKEVFAEAVHARSRRSTGPFLKLNCAAFSETLLESELFGHERGSFTGAGASKPGLLETAEGGTVFLDEVGELPMSLQVKLLRVLEDRKVMRVGALRPREIDIRIVSATNRDLEAESERGTFRQDLFFRLNGIALTIPPLRERTAEIEPLARVFIQRASAAMGRAAVPGLAPETLTVLRAYRWPGNIRELRNAMERAVLLCTGPNILPEHLPLDRMRSSAARAQPGSASITGSYSAASAPAMTAPPLAPPDARPAEGADGAFEAERQRIIDALEKCAGNQTQAAVLLGISRRTLVTRLEEYNLPRPRKR